MFTFQQNLSTSTHYPLFLSKTNLPTLHACCQLQLMKLYNIKCKYCKESTDNYFNHIRTFDDNKCLFQMQVVNFTNIIFKTMSPLLVI
jgi:hypothetical protein